jgi:hypothetical protein
MYWYNISNGASIIPNGYKQGWTEQEALQNAKDKIDEINNYNSMHSPILGCDNN